jgi:hypothetical protein
MRRTLREEEPQLPSTMITSLRPTELLVAARQRHSEPPKLISEIKGDLDWIAMKALEKDRARRYETANGLAMDVQRYLNSEPVLARPPSRVYRLQKLVRRNKIVFAAGGAVALALFAGLGLSTWLLFREREALEREANLRSEAEDRAKITQAVMLVNQEKYDEADRVLNQVHSFPADPTLDCVSALRSVGEWLALQGRWQQSAEHYAALLRIDKLNSLGQIAFDYQSYGVVWAKLGGREQYELFRQTAVTNFNETPVNGVFIACLQFAATKPQLELLKPMANYFESHSDAPTPNHVSQWIFMPIALWHYRIGDYAGASEWARRGREQKTKFPACDADLHLIVAMTDFQGGQISEACSELAQGRQEIETKIQSGLEHGKADAGYWFDWVFASVLSQEASALIDYNSAPSEAE